jgi:hypothetical protein
METLNRYEIEIILKTGIIKDKLGANYSQEKIEILAENDDYICLNDWRFNSVHKKSCSYDSSLNKPSISSDTNNSCFGTRINYMLYSDKKKRKSTIKREIAEYIADKFGCFADIDLSFLDD